MPTESPLVSVVIPTYNRAELLGRTLASVGVQHYRPIEVIVIDDASEDDTHSVIGHARRSLGAAGIALRTRTLVKNSGPAAALNTGIGLATGSIVGFLGSDDLWKPQFVSTIADLLDRYPACGVAFSGQLAIDLNDRVTAVRTTGLEDGPKEGQLRTPFEMLVRGFPLQTPGALVRRSVLDAVGPFDETLALWSDGDFWYRVAKRFDFAYTVEPLVCIREHTGNITRSRVKGGVEWLEYGLRVDLRHLDDVREPSTRRFLLKRIERAQVLLQEQLLRERRRDDRQRTLLAAAHKPTSVRYRLGRLVMHGPLRLGSWYAAAIRAAGNARRRHV